MAMSRFSYTAPLIPLILFSSFSFAGEYWNTPFCLGKCENSIKFITSHKPHYSGLVNSNIDAVYRNVRQGIYECYSMEGKPNIIISSEYYQDIKMAEIYVKADGANLSSQTALYIQIKHKEDNSSSISAWGNEAGSWDLPAKHIHEIAMAGIEVDCKMIFEIEDKGAKPEIPQI